MRVGPDEMQRARNDVKDGGEHKADPLRGNQDVTDFKSSPYFRMEDPRETRQRQCNPRSRDSLSSGTQGSTPAAKPSSVMNSLR